jgi:hypothetical protein
MANINTKQKRRELAKAFTLQRKAGKPIVPPPRKGGSLWKGALNRRKT